MREGKATTILLLRGGVTVVSVLGIRLMIVGDAMDGTWSAVGALSTAFAAIIVLVGLLYARSQIGEAKRTRNAELLFELQDRYHSLEIRAIRKRLLAGEFGPPSRFDSSDLSDADNHAYFALLDHLELLGVLVANGLLDIDLVVAAFSKTPPQVWYYIRPHVLETRKKVLPGAYVHFEKLTARYEDYYEKRFGVLHPAREWTLKLEALEE